MPKLNVGSARLNEYFGVWAISANYGSGRAKQATRLDLARQLAQHEAPESEAESLVP